MSKADAKVEELVSMIERGELRLPEMQRRFVWTAPRVRDLLDSLYRGYPSGAILVWESAEAIPQQEFAIAQQTNPFQTSRLLLDGQQRLTSLSAVLRGVPVVVRGRRRPIEILFNLEHPDQLSVVTEVSEDGGDDDSADDVDSEGDEADSSEDELLRRFERMTFVVSTSKLEQLPHWVKVTDVFKSNSDAPFLQRAGVTNLDDPRFAKYTARLACLRGIRSYTYRMDILDRNLSYDEVTEIFVRVNSLGAKLRGSDLALAQITAKWRDSLKTFLAFQEQCAEVGFDLDLGIHLKNMVAFATDQSRFLTIGNVRLDALQSAWEDSRKGLEFALNFLKSNAEVDSPTLLSSPFILVTLARYGHRHSYSFSPSESQQLRHWFLLANAKGRYSRGSSETLLDQDLATLKQGGEVSELLDRLRQQVGRLDITPEEFMGRSQRSALFKTMFLAFRNAGAKDWVSNLTIALDHSGSQHSLQFHHFFPKAFLSGHYQVPEINDIANLCFIGGKTNRSILDKSPEDYFPPLVSSRGADIFRAQCIPTDDLSLFKLENYKQFLARRRELMSQKLNAFLGTGP